MQSEINTEGVDAVVSRVLQLRNAHDDRPQADRDTGMPQRVSELVAMVDPGAEVTKVRIAEQPRGHHATSRHGLATLIITAWSRNCPRRPRVCARHM
jgi:hypothetical protein